MKFQDSSLNGLKVTVGTKSVTHAPTHARSKSNMPHHIFQSWGHKYVYPCIPQLYYIKVGCRLSTLHRHDDVRITCIYHAGKM